MYQALYRKWRPQTFDEVVGQEHITETLKNQVRNDRLSHAYLFIGSRGTGKTTCARILARAVNCEHPVNGNPCGVCAACRGISDGSILDVVELDAASNNGVDNVRALRDEAVFSPAEVKKRVYIIDEVHMLSIAAFNALLKILEEPPAHLMFILATTELHKVPATILSRCQRHSFRRIDTARIAQYLGTIAEREGMALEPDAAELIARLAEGGVRDALSLLDQCSVAEKIDVEAVYAAMGLAGKRRIAELLDHILRHDTPAALKEFAGMWMDGKDPVSLLSELSGLLRDILMMHVAPATAKELVSGGFDGATLAGFSKRMTTEELLSALDSIQRTMGGLRDTKNPKIAVELCLVALCDRVGGDSPAALRARISRLEEQLAAGIPMQIPVRTPAPEPEEDWGVPPAPRTQTPEEEEDEPDLSAFQEEQPEDAFLARREAAPEPRPTAAPAPAAPVSVSWKAICEKASPGLPIDLRAALEDESKVRGVMEGNLLRLQVLPGFVYKRFDRQDVLGCFAKAASELYGGEVRVMLGELKPEERQKRDLEELRKFKEVKFV